MYFATTEQNGRPFPYHLNNKVHWIDLKTNTSKTISNHLNKICTIFETRKQVANVIRHVSPHIIIGISMALVDVIQAKRGKIPFIIQCHTIKERTWSFERNNILMRIKFKRYLSKIKKCNALVVLTETDKEKWGKGYNTIVIPNIVKQRQNDNIATGEAKRIIFAGRIHEDKGLSYLLDVWRIVSKRYPDWWLDIFGSGETHDVSKLRNEISNMHNIRYNGNTKYLFNEFISSSIHILTSKQESFGLVIVEAMSCGLPSVSFDSPHGPRNIIHDGHDGYIVPLGNVELMAEKIAYLIDHTKLRKQMGQVAVQTAKKYSAEIILPQWEDLFKRLVHI